MSFKRSSIDWNNIKFHHYFGGGARYSCGEDSMFLNDCFKKKLNIYTCSDTIGIVNHKESTWYDGINDKFLIDKGILFYALMGNLSYAAGLYHCVKHRKSLYNKMGWKEAFKLIIKGVKIAKENK
jgi:hypothetical protein